MAQPIRNLRIFVHLFSDAVSNKFTNHTITMLLAMCLNGMADVPYSLSGKCCFDSLVQGLFCNFQQLLDFISDFSDTESVTRVTAKTIEQGSA